MIVIVFTQSNGIHIGASPNSITIAFSGEERVFGAPSTLPLCPSSAKQGKEARREMQALAAVKRCKQAELSRGQVI